MSMTLLTILQILWVSATYLITTLLLPWLLLRRKLTQFRLPARFMAYCVAGNFFCINLVLLLQLLHISNRVTLIAGTLAPFIVVAVRRRKRLFALLERGTDSVGSFSEGEMGAKTLVLRAGEGMRKYSAGWLARWIAPRWLDVSLTAVVILLVLVMYGFNTVSVYGFCSSDMVVHNHWINYMDHNQIFVDGVYPFGFHCVLYYLHEVFAIPTYVLLRVFSLTQTLMIHVMLLAFLKSVCRSKYTPYVGIIAYLTTGKIYQFAYMRYYAALPQEYGMIFILPAAYFAMAFLKSRDYTVLPKRWRVEGSAKYSLILFSSSISMTLATHFYDTAAAGLLCVGIGAGFCFRCRHWQYLRRILIAGVAGILTGVLPMAAAYALGTPLQGSLLWGASTISSEAAESSAGIAEHIFTVLQANVANNSRAAAVLMLSSIGVLLALGIVFYKLHRPEHGGVLVSFAVFMVLLCVLQAAPGLGLPSLIESGRCAMYIGYGLAVVWSLCADAVAYLVFRDLRTADYAGTVGVVAVCVAVVLTGVRTPEHLVAYESNEAMICLTNILRENKDSTSWTICSANDERTMIWGRGYHYETIDFLREQEKLTSDTSLTIPTDTVYFFIDKVPLFYSGALNSARPEWKVSPEGAGQPLSVEGGIQPYLAEARWVTMSHMYYWAQAFRELYPNEMKVYYETDDFVCYRIRQDGYNLYNFAIDYGYNT